jgi:hypothetical protein
VTAPRGIVLALLLAVVLRLLWPLADPPPRLSWSSGVLTDPLAKTLPARHAIEEGDWGFEESPYAAAFPLTNGIAWATYRVFGPGRLAYQVVSTAIALAGLLAIVLALRRRVGDRAALLAAILGGVSFWLGMFARSPVAENVVATLLAGSCYFALGSRRGERVAAGALAAAAVLFGKYHAIAFWPGLLAYAWLERRDRSGTLPYLFGGVAVALPWLVLVLVPRWDAIAEFVTHVATGMSGSPTLITAPWLAVLDPLHAVREAWVFHQAPVAGIVGGFFVVWTVASRRARDLRIRNGTALFAFWCLGVWLWYGLLAYQAPRYYVIGGLGLVAAAAAQLDEWWRDGSVRMRRPSGAGEIVAAIVAVGFLGVVVVDMVREYLAVVMLAERTRQPDATTALFRALTPIAGALTTKEGALRWALLPAGLTGIVVAVSATRRVSFSARRVAIAAVVVAVLFEAARFGGWIRERKFVLREVRDAMPALIGPDAVVLGSFAPTVTLGTGITALSYLDPDHRIDPFSRYRVTHVLMDDRHDPRSLTALAPDLESRVAFLQSWAFRARNVMSLSLYRVKDAPGYEPTAFERGVALMGESRWEEALGVFAEHRTAAPETVALLSQESSCRYQLGDLEESQRLLGAALAMAPDDTQALQNYALVARARGDYAAAEENLRRALRRDPQNHEIIRRLREVLELRARP